MKKRLIEQNPNVANHNNSYLANKFNKNANNNVEDMEMLTHGNEDAANHLSNY
jgi:hypothetical protein